MNTIPKVFIFFSIFLLSCTHTDPYKVTEFVTPDNQEIKTRLALTLDEQIQGLSGIKDNEFDNDEGMLFYYLVDQEHAFWMPDTYFDLDIIYLDQHFKILDIVRKVPHYIGRQNPERIPRVRAVYSRHVLELKSSSEIAQKLKVGDLLRWNSPVTPQQIESKIRLGQ
jgi:uncharacterized membrane protein (UPF0127 family)